VLFIGVFLCFGLAVCLDILATRVDVNWWAFILRNSVHERQRLYHAAAGRLIPESCRSVLRLWRRECSHAPSLRMRLFKERNGTYWFIPALLQWTRVLRDLHANG
jgi:hypothetical protein